MKKIEVYGTTWCPDCTRAKRVLDKHNVKFDWHDIDKDKKACDYVQKVNNGNKSVPTIVFTDGSILVEPRDNVLEEKLKEAGYL